VGVIPETEDEVIKRLNEWKDNVESKDMWLCGVRGRGVLAVRNGYTRNVVV